jgi:hypothetical protein
MGIKLAFSPLVNVSATLYWLTSRVTFSSADAMVLRDTPAIKFVLPERFKSSAEAQ